MKHAVILHGICDRGEYYEMDFPSSSNAHWLPWLQQKFLRSGILCQTLEMPKPYAPSYQDWKETFEQLNTHKLDIVVGHSAGCGFILKWLAENPNATFEKLIFVAPWRDPEREMGDFLVSSLDPSIPERIGQFDILHSEDDMDDVATSFQEIVAAYPQATVHLFQDKGHFCFGDLGTHEFPELWEICRD